MANTIHKCQTCEQSFECESALCGHIEQFDSQSQSIQSRIRQLTAELQQLASQLQQVSAHSRTYHTEAINASTDNKHDDQQQNSSCPQKECNNQFGARKSLQRHYQNHTAYPSTQKCTGCRSNDFKTIRRYINHFRKCLAAHGTIDTRPLMLKQKKLMCKLAREELEMTEKSQDEVEAVELYPAVEETINQPLTEERFGDKALELLGRDALSSLYERPIVFPRSIATQDPMDWGPDLSAFYPSSVIDTGYYEISANREGQVPFEIIGSERV